VKNPKPKKPKQKRAKRQPLSRLEKLLILNYVKGADEKGAAIRLNAIGLQASEIAPLLGKTSNAVRVLLSRSKKGKRS
jgi:DNA-directed RNA polymerase specialized sigma24 family protein